MITGEEGVYAAYSINDNDNGREQDGITLRQLALKDFMCAIVSAGSLDVDSVVSIAENLTTAYITQLNTKP